MVISLAEAGADLVIAARRLGPINDAVTKVKSIGRKALAITCDVSNSSQVDNMVKQTLNEFGKIDVLINNAGLVRTHGPTPIWDITDEDWKIGIDVNLTSAFYLSLIHI